MPTRTEAAQELYKAVEEFIADHRYRIPDDSETLVNLRSAANVYLHATATPDALPAEVARVVEAAAKFSATFGSSLRSGHYGAEGEMLALAVDAYRSTQPDPLPVRLARLRPGSVVEICDKTKFRVLVNLPDHKELVCEFASPVIDSRSIVDYQHVIALISESL